MNFKGKYVQTTEASKIRYYIYLPALPNTVPAIVISINSFALNEKKAPHTSANQKSEKCPAIASIRASLEKELKRIQKNNNEKQQK